MNSADLEDLLLFLLFHEIVTSSPRTFPFPLLFPFSLFPSQFILLGLPRTLPLTEKAPQNLYTMSLKKKIEFIYLYPMAVNQTAEL